LARLAKGLLQVPLKLFWSESPTPLAVEQLEPNLRGQLKVFYLRQATLSHFENRVASKRFATYGEGFGKPGGQLCVTCSHPVFRCKGDRLKAALNYRFVGWS
jgi:hypothetical protein